LKLEVGSNLKLELNILQR